MDRELNQAIYKACGIRVRDELDLVACWFKLLYNNEIIIRTKNEVVASEYIHGPSLRYTRKKHIIIERISGKISDKMHVNEISTTLYAGILSELYGGDVQ